jgi:transcriptional regulator with XRE-family HTH domain
MKKLGQRIREARGGESQTAWGRPLRLSQSRVSELELGERPTFAELMRLRPALGVTMNTLTAEWTAEDAA